MTPVAQPVALPVAPPAPLPPIAEPAAPPAADPAAQATAQPTAQPAGPPVAAPFVGPRPYAVGEKSFFGRDRERLELLDLVIAERIVLLYSPSGAGKTSLVQAACVPALREEGFTVPGVARVTFDSPAEAAQPAANRYVFAVLLSLEEGRPQPDQLPIDDLAQMSLPGYLELRWQAALRGGGLVLILDQFEEILTIDPTDLVAKQEFFAQLGQALRNRHLWALLSMREEHVAGLDPYRSLVPTRLSTTYRLELLTEQQARQAMQQASAQAGVTFTDSAARRLVDDLRRVRVERPGQSAGEQPGPTVEPTQLQVVCLRLWSLLGGKTTIEESDVKALGSADTALADYYAEIVGRLGDRERLVRDWIEQKLITEDGLRNQVQRDHAVKSQGVEESEIGLLAGCYLVREERRRGIRWLELAHDRLIEPLRNNNTTWREEHLNRVQWQAVFWDRYGRHAGLELSGKALAEAEEWASSHGDQVTPVEEALLAASRQSRRRRRNRVVIVAGFVAVALAAVVCGVLYQNWLGARPWAHWSHLFTGEPHQLRGNIVSIGRIAEGPLKSQVVMQPEVISRLHLFVTPDQKVHDVRSTNGTTINAGLLAYGWERQLSDGDIVVIAGIAPFRFSPIALAPWYKPFTSPAAPPASRPPDGTWAMFIDGPSREVVPLMADEYFVEPAADGKRAFVPARSLSARSLLKITRDPADGDLEIRTLGVGGGDPLFTTLKFSDRLYVAVEIPSDVQVSEYLKDIFGGEYISKLSFCFGPVQTKERRIGLVTRKIQILDAGHEPDCKVGPFQVVSLPPPRKAAPPDTTK